MDRLTLKKTKTVPQHQRPVILLVRHPQNAGLYKRGKEQVLTLAEVQALAERENVWVWYKEPSGAARYQRFGKPGTVG